MGGKFRAAWGKAAGGLGQFPCTSPFLVVIWKEKEIFSMNIDFTIEFKDILAMIISPIFIAITTQYLIERHPGSYERERYEKVVSRFLINWKLFSTRKIFLMKI